jgi:hypothetical protein
MNYAAQLPNTRKMLAPAVALVIGAAGAIGAYTVIDDADVAVQSPKVIVTETPAPPSEGVAAKDEAGVAAVVAGSKAPVSSFGKDEAGTAAAIGGSGPVVSDFGKDEAGTAAAIGGSGPVVSDFGKDEAGTAAAIGGPR